MFNAMIMCYDPSKHPCRNCDKRHAFCHGTCEKYLEFERNRPRNPRNMYNARGKMKDVFHKKGRVLTNEKKNY